MIYTLVSGGIFNAVLVPQIVRTLKAKDAETKLNKLITLAITMLLAVTILMALCTPLLTKLYVNGSPETMALATSFTLWCMPQIFFYGLYTVVGQILAAKDHFTAYAWSSVVRTSSAASASARSSRYSAVPPSIRLIFGPPAKSP